MWDRLNIRLFFFLSVDLKKHCQENTKSEKKTILGENLAFYIEYMLFYKE